MSAIRLISGNTITVDEKADLVDMERAATYFFKNKHGKRETFSVHRGCIIVRNTVDGQRKTAVHLFGTLSEDNKKTFFCVCAGNPVNSISEAKNLIDTVLSQGWYNYGLVPFDKNKFLVVCDGGSYLKECTVSEIEKDKSETVRQARAKVFNLATEEELIWDGSGKAKWVKIG